MADQTNKAPSKTRKQGHMRLWKFMAFVSVVSTILFGLAYVAAQISHFGWYVDDPLFIAAIIVNTLVTAAFGFHFADQLRGMIDALNEQTQDQAPYIDADQAFRSILNHPLAPIYAVAHAGAVALWVYLLFPWSPLCPAAAASGQISDVCPPALANHVSTGGVSLDILLAGFLFCGNLMIGYGVFCIIRFWRLSARRIRKVEMNIFNSTRLDIALYQDLCKRIVILVAIVATIAVISLADSRFDVGPTTILFSLASLTAVAVTYIVPLMPLTTRFQHIRFAELHRIENRIEAIYQQMVVAEDPAPLRDTLDEFIALRERVRKVKTLPPGGEFSVFAAFGVSLLTFIPTIMQQLFVLISGAGLGFTP